MNPPPPHIADTPAGLRTAKKAKSAPDSSSSKSRRARDRDDQDDRDDRDPEDQPAPKKPKKSKDTDKVKETVKDKVKDKDKAKSKAKSKAKFADNLAIAEAASEAAAIEDAVANAVAGPLWTFAPVRSDERAAAKFLVEHAIAVSNCDPSLAPILTFAAARFPDKIAAALTAFPNPTHIQSVTWPPLLTGRDLVGIAATGSGKTLAFGIPAMLHIMNRLASTRVSGKPKRRIRALVMSPTRELAMQIQDTFDGFRDASGLSSVCLYGGAPKHEQKQMLRSGPDIVVATPGRLMDFMGESECDISDVEFFVLDEADRMLDLGFEPNIRDIAAAIKTKSRQTVMFSATWPQSVMNLSKKYLKNPVHVTVGSKDLSANANIEQRVEVLADGRAKENRLAALLRDYHKTRKNRVMVFALYKKEAARLEQYVRGLGYNANAIHGDLTQERRSAAISAFKDGSCPLLIATDVAARGIDVPNVEYVINYTYPLTTEDYCHRIGRTGRAGKTGIAHTFFTPLDKAHSGALINVLKQANQKVPDELMKFGTTVKKKLDANYGAFTKDIDPNAKATKITFGDDDD
ncbi:RNA-dependent ATPase [Entophlyctis luteolus]|nr:RNA-dependent ATPase [Entophlyctis luteolus]